MSHRPRGLLAAALAVLACAQPAAAQTTSTLPLKGADGATYQEAGVNDAGGRFYPGHSLFGWNGSTLQAVKVDPTTGDLIVNQGGAWTVGLNGPLPAFAAPPTFNLGTLNGAATDASLQQLRTLLAGTLSVTVTNPTSGGGATVPTGAAGSPNPAVVTVQGVAGGAGVPVTGTFYQATQPVSAAALPLPSGAATATGVAAVVTALGTPLQAGGLVAVSNLPATQAVSAAALPLPSGAATASGVAAVVTALGSPLQAGGSVSVSNLPATQAVSAASLPLPAGASTAAGVAAVTTALGSPFQAGGSVANTDFGTRCDVVSADASLTAGAVQRCQMTTKGRLKVGLSSAAADGATAASDNDQVGGLGPDGLQHAFHLDGSNRLITAPQTSTPDTPVGDLAATRANTAADAANNAAFQGEVAMTVGTTYAVGRSLKLLCPSATTITVTYADGSSGQWSIPGPATGSSPTHVTLPIAVTAVTAESVACTSRANLK